MIIGPSQIKMTAKTGGNIRFSYMLSMNYIEDLTRVVISYEIYETSLRRVS